MEIKLGYCCISTIHEKLRCNRCSTKTYLESKSQMKGHDLLVEKARENLHDLCQLLQENYKNKIFAFRISEQLLPQIDLGYYTIDELDEELKKVGKIANEYDIQLSTHPSQYYVLNSLKDEVVQRSINSLNLYAKILKRMNLERHPNIILHVGVKNGYETTEKACDAFCKNFRQLDMIAQSYLVIENDHVSFTVEDCLYIHRKIGIPIVFDNMHYHWNPGNLTFQQAVNEVVKTWGNRIPKFHLASDKEEKKHAHDDYVLISDYLELETAIEKTGIDQCYIMLECKQKDKAVLKLYEYQKEMKFVAVRKGL